MNSKCGAVVFAWLLSLVGVEQSRAGPPDCRLRQYASLDLAGAPGGDLLVPVMVDKQPAFMILDTGAGFSSISQAAVTSMALTTHSIFGYSDLRVGKAPVRDLAAVSEFALGTLQLKNVGLLVTAEQTPVVAANGGRVIGFLGMDVLSHVDVEIDLEKRKLNLFAQDHCPGRVVYWSHGYESVTLRQGDLGEMYFPMTLEGKSLEAVLATADAFSSVRTDVTQKFFNLDGRSPPVRAESDASGDGAAHYRSLQLSSGGFRIVNAHVMLVDPEDHDCRVSSVNGVVGYENCLGLHPLKLGRNVLSKLHFYIATKEKVLYFTPADAT